MISGFAFKSKHMGVGNSRVVKIKNVVEPHVLVDECDVLDETQYPAEKIAKYKLTEDDVLISMTGYLGRVAMMPSVRGTYFLNQRVAKLVPNEMRDLAFIKFHLQNDAFKDHCEAFTDSATAQPNISVKSMSQFEIEWPSFENRQAIAEVLSSLDDKIDLLKRQNKTLEDMAEALFRQWFIEEAQDEWPEVQFQEIVKVSRGVSYSGKLLGDDGIPMHNLKSASVGGGYRYDGIKFFQGDVKPEKILSPGEILMVNTDMTPDNRIIGQPIRVPSFYPKSICSHHMYHLGFECSATQTFVYQYFRIEENRELLANYSNGTTVSMLGSKVLKTVEIPLPPIQLREAFMEYRRDIDDKLDSNEMKIRNLSAQRDTLLPKLMSGEVRVQMD